MEKFMLRIQTICFDRSTYIARCIESDFREFLSGGNTIDPVFYNRRVCFECDARGHRDDGRVAGVLFRIRVGWFGPSVRASLINLSINWQPLRTGPAPSLMAITGLDPPSPKKMRERELLDPACSPRSLPMGRTQRDCDPRRRTARLTVCCTRSGAKNIFIGNERMYGL